MILILSFSSMTLSSMQNIPFSHQPASIHQLGNPSEKKKSIFIAPFYRWVNSKSKEMKAVGQDHRQGMMNLKLQILQTYAFELNSALARVTAFTCKHQKNCSICQYHR